MKRVAPWVLLVLASCDPDIPQEPAPPSSIVAEFDPAATPPVVPLPNDLARDPATGTLVVPAAPTDSAAQRELDETYLTGLDGFPQESTAEARFTGDLDPARVSATTVLAFDTTSGAAVPIAPAYADRRIAVAPPEGGWLRAHTYAIALVGGANGLRGAAGEPVLGSETWALVSSGSSLVTCQDLTSPDCRPTVDVIPSEATDPQERLRDQTAKAIRLESLRRAYAPLFDWLAAHGVARADVPLLWTFRIVDAGEMTFDPARGVVPFPFDALRLNGKVNLPNPKTGQPITPQDCQSSDAQIQLVCGLNTLDGFSTLAPPVSENSPTLGAATQATIDPASVTAATVGLVPLASQAPEPERTAPKVMPCLGCLSSKTPSGDPQVTPQQLQWRLDAPLDEKTTYLAYVTTDVKDDKGKRVIAAPAFALLRSTAPLVDAGKSTVSVLDDAQAAQLEPLRAALAPAFDALAKAGIPRTRLALAFPFTTQSEATLLDALRAYPAKVPGLPVDPVAVTDATAAYTAAAAKAGIPIDGVASFFTGTFVSPVAVTGAGGTLDLAAPKVLPVDFVMAVPKTPAPAGGYPVTLFGHGFTRWRNDLLPIANALAKAGQVVIASDVIFHGERTSCTGAKAATGKPSDDSACADPVKQRCDEDPLVGRCVARLDADRAACTPGASGDATCAAAGQGRCVAADAKCEGGDFARDGGGRPLISGWNVFSLTNFFATRDNFRQQVIDLAQLVRVLGSTGATGLAARAGVALDLAKLGYVGQSLGGILGTLYNAVSPETSNVVLDVPGGALPSIILEAPAFAAQKKALLDGLAAQGITPGTPAFDQFLGTVQWILDPADPANMGYRLTHPVDVGSGVSAPNAARRALIQFIEGDQVVPNDATFALLRGANRSFVPTPPSFGCTAPLACYEFTEAGDAFDATSATPETRHGFLLQPPSGARGLALTTKAQTQAATFLATGALP